MGQTSPYPERVQPAKTPPWDTAGTRLALLRHSGGVTADWAVGTIIMRPPWHLPVIQGCQVTGHIQQVHLRFQRQIHTLEVWHVGELRANVRVRLGLPLL